MSCWKARRRRFTWSKLELTARHETDPRHARHVTSRHVIRHVTSVRHVTLRHVTCSRLHRPQRTASHKMTNRFRQKGMTEGKIQRVHEERMKERNIETEQKEEKRPLAAESPTSSFFALAFSILAAFTFLGHCRTQSTFKIVGNAKHTPRIGDPTTTHKKKTERKQQTRREREVETSLVKGMNSLPPM